MFSKTLRFSSRGLRPLFTAALLGILAASNSAFAGDTAGDDEVTLKNGGSVRGTVVTVAPGDKVVIVAVGDKTPRSIPWSEVADVEKGKHADKSEGSVEPGSAGPGYDKPNAEDPDDEPKAKRAKKKQVTATVHIDSDEPVTLYERGPTGVVATGRYTAIITTGEPVCGSPCGEEVDVSRQKQFFIAGDGIPESRNFRLDRYSSDVTIDVSPGSNGQRIGGIVMMSLGGAGIVGGALMLVLGATTGSISGDDSTPQFIGGGVAMGVGVGSLAGGIATFVTGRTSVDIRKGATEPKTPTDGEEEATFQIDSRPTAIAPNYWLGQF